MATAKTYAQQNTVVFQGRVANATIRSGKNGEFLSVALIHNAADNDSGYEICFTNNNGLLSFEKKGYGLKGRMITVTGHMSAVEAFYTNADNEAQLLQRPRIRLTNACVMEGGIGPAPKSSQTPAKQELDNREVASQEAPVDQELPSLY